MWFANKHDEGVVYHEYFNPLSDVTVALVLTSVRHFSLTEAYISTKKRFRSNVGLMSGPPVSRSMSHSLLPSTVQFLTHTSNAYVSSKNTPRSMNSSTKSARSSIMLQGQYALLLVHVSTRCADLEFISM